MGILQNGEWNVIYNGILQNGEWNVIYNGILQNGEWKWNITEWRMEM